MTITVTGTNDGPVAVADTAPATENAALTIDVLANDTDVDNGARLTRDAACAPAGQGTASVVGNQVVFNPGTDSTTWRWAPPRAVMLSYTMQRRARRDRRARP